MTSPNARIQEEGSDDLRDDGFPKTSGEDRDTEIRSHRELQSARGNDAFKLASTLIAPPQTHRRANPPRRTMAARDL
jgi:hypothetical protein